MKSIPERCLKGHHNWKEIQRSRHGWDESENVVDWCRDCGTIVTFTEFDGRHSNVKVTHADITIDYSLSEKILTENIPQRK